MKAYGPEMYGKECRNKLVPGLLTVHSMPNFQDPNPC